jgi:hypothetical protein
MGIKLSEGILNNHSLVIPKMIGKKNGILVPMWEEKTCI